MERYATLSGLRAQRNQLPVENFHDILSDFKHLASLARLFFSPTCMCRKTGWFTRLSLGLGPTLTNGLMNDMLSLHQNRRAHLKEYVENNASIKTEYNKMYSAHKAKTSM